MTPEQRAAVELYRLMVDLENRNRQAAFEVRLALAKVNAENQWDMADVAAAACFNVWPREDDAA